MTTVIVLGTTYSGSSAVYDYLNGRPDSYSPLADAEYLLPHVPYGLLQLRSACSEAFHYTIAHEAFLRFKEVALRLARPAKKYRYGGGYEQLLPGFSREIDQLVDSMIDSRMSMRFIWDELNLDSAFDSLLNQIRHKLRPSNASTNLERLLPLQHDFLTDRVREMHDRLFRRPSDDLSFTLLNQAGSGWNPDQSTNFFPKRRVVVVSRDPRDQFAELKKYKGSIDVNQFVRWFRNLQKRTVTGIPEIIYLRFEDFVFRHDTSCNSLLAFLGLSEKPTPYDPFASQTNVGRYRTELTVQEIEVIESKLRADYAGCFFDG